MYNREWAVLLFIIIFLIGCGDHGDPVGVDTGAVQSVGASANASSSNRVVWGLWKVVIPEDRSGVEVIPDRTTAMHLNTVRLLEVEPCANCLTIQNIEFLPDNIVQADMKLVHPFPGLLKLTGFDVRGIFISGAGYDFPKAVRQIAWGAGVPRMLNPDGYTQLFNPTDYPETFPAALGYIDGKFANGGDLSATLNPYVGYENDKARRMFLPGIVSTRTVEIKLASGPIQFGYAVDASWQLVDTVTDPVTDFPPDANAIEAYRIDVQVGDSYSVSATGPTEVVAEIFDHQGLDTISTVTIEAPGIFSDVITLDYDSVGSSDSWIYKTVIQPVTSSPDGVYPFMVRVQDTCSDQNLGEVDAWQLVGVVVSGEQADGWARTWGEVNSDRSYDAVVDNSGNIYVCGWFEAEVDFDPGAGEWVLTSNGARDAYLSKFNSAGGHIWTYAWGGESSDESFGLTLDPGGNVLVGGYYGGKVDFDPGDETDIRTSPGSGGAFLTKFDPDGNHIWVRDWPGYCDDYVGGVSSDMNGCFISGSYIEGGDFDPGPLGDFHECNGEHDIFVCWYDFDGNFIWARTWGAEGRDEAFGIAIAPAGNSLYVTGKYELTVDFDPGPGVDEHTSVGGNDIFLSKISFSGDLEWARTWGGLAGTTYTSDFGEGVAVYGNNVYVTGLFVDTVDFDPGPGAEEITASGNTDCFLSCFNAEGDFNWVRTWGAFNYDGAWDCETDAAGNVVVGGWFSNTVDFDPDPLAEEIHTSNGATDIYIVKYNGSGDFTWARTIGGQSNDFSLGIGMDSSGTIYGTGIYSGEMDFDPGPGVDEHENNGSEDAFLMKLPSDGYW